MKSMKNKNNLFKYVANNLIIHMIKTRMCYGEKLALKREWSQKNMRKVNKKW